MRPAEVLAALGIATNAPIVAAIAAGAVAELQALEVLGDVAFVGA
jgi:hypothetical protein